jgi:steroid 5-alpha reductase family enzyme
MLKEKTGHFYPVINFIGIHMVPTIVVYFCTIPAAYAIMNGLSVNIGSIIFILVSIFAATMQGIADIQMHKYRKNKKTPFIRNGAWKYSRHPNYLAEILMWWGIGIACTIAVPTTWYLLIGALANTLLFTFVSIPMAEKRQGKKEGFEEYKKETNYLLPFKIKR